MLCKLICQDDELDPTWQGGSRVHIILVALHMLEVNGDSHERVTDPVDSPDEIGMGRAAWGKLLDLLSLMEGSQIVASHYYRPRGNCIERTKAFDGQE